MYHSEIIYAHLDNEAGEDDSWWRYFEVVSYYQEHVSWARVRKHRCSLGFITVLSFWPCFHCCSLFSRLFHTLVASQTAKADSGRREISGHLSYRLHDSDHAYLSLGSSSSRLRICSKLVRLCAGSNIMAQVSAAPHWDLWDFSVGEPVPPENLPYIKESKVKRYLSRKEKHEDFMNKDAEEMLAYMEENQKLNDQKKTDAQQRKWHKTEGGRWEKWSGKWYWMEWYYKQRWSGPYQWGHLAVLVRARLSENNKQHAIVSTWWF